MNLLPNLTGSPKDVTKADGFRIKALDRMPAIEHLLYLPELLEASWWLTNVRRLHMPKVWLELVNDPKEKLKLDIAIHGQPELSEQEITMYLHATQAPQMRNNWTVDSVIVDRISDLDKNYDIYDSNSGLDKYLAQDERYIDKDEVPVEPEFTDWLNSLGEE